MKKKCTLLLGIVVTAMTFAACGKTEDTIAPSVIIPETGSSSTVETSVSVVESSSEETEKAQEPDVPPAANMYRSELTNEWISDSLQNQRPIAVMVDNEKTALDHYGVNQADIVYELMNSTANGRITRLMVIVKDWEQVTKLGSVRSVRPTNFMLAAEYNAILCHDGGPYYIEEYTGRDWVNNLSGGFARYTNGKSSEFTEYITYDSYTNPNTGTFYSGLGQRIKSAGYDTAYNSYYPGKHFKFSSKDFYLSDGYNKTQTAVDVDLPFPHNSSELIYNSATQTYDYYEYGGKHIDAIDGEVTTFKNVILQSCDFVQFDGNGYMKYFLVTDTPSNEQSYVRAQRPERAGELQFFSDSSDGTGYYITNGEAIPITWTKDIDEGLTVYKSAETGEEIVLNTGKTYIGIVPSDSWNQLFLK